MAAVQKYIIDKLSREKWAQAGDSWLKDGYKLSITRLQNDNYAVEITKMSVANVRNVSSDDLMKLIEQPKINY